MNEHSKQIYKAELSEEDINREYFEYVKKVSNLVATEVPTRQRALTKE